MSLLVPLFATAQTTGGGLVGRASDERDRPLAAVEVTATHVATGWSRTLKTASDGRYRFPSLPTGSYEILAERHGYTSVAVRKIDVLLGVARRVDVRMRQVAEDEQVTVTAPVRVVESAPPIGIVVRREIIADVPLRARIIGEFGALSPLAGSRLINPLAETILNGATAASDVPLDAIEEINATTRQYPAEVGRTSGGVLLVAPRVGRNEFEGDAFGLYRTRRRTSQWGVAAGGPIAKDVSHFFAAIDGDSDDGQRLFATANVDLSSRHFVEGDYAAARDGSGGALARDLWLARESVWNELVLHAASGANEIRDSLAGSIAGPVVRHDWTVGGLALQNGGNSFFAQDQVIVGKLAVNAGVRYDRWRNTSGFSPRVGLTYDVNGSGRNLVRASYGRYLNPDESDASLGYSWQVNPWVALNVDALHSKPANERTHNAVAVSGFVQFSTYLSLTGSYTYSNGVVANDLARHSAAVAGTLHLPAGFWLAGIGRYRSAPGVADQPAGTDLRGAKTFTFDRYAVDVLFDVFNAFAQRSRTFNDRRAEQLGLRVNF